MLKDAPCWDYIWDAFSEKELSQGVEKMTKSPLTHSWKFQGFVLRELCIDCRAWYSDALRKRLAARRRWAANRNKCRALNRALRVLSAHGIFERGGVYAHPHLTPATLGSPASPSSFVVSSIPAHIWSIFAQRPQTDVPQAEKSLPDGFLGLFANHPEPQPPFQ